MEWHLKMGTIIFALFGLLSTFCASYCVIISIFSLNFRLLLSLRVLYQLKSWIMMENVSRRCTFRYIIAYWTVIMCNILIILFYFFSLFCRYPVSAATIILLGISTEWPCHSRTRNYRFSCCMRYSIPFCDQRSLRSYVQFDINLYQYSHFW